MKLIAAAVSLLTWVGCGGARDERPPAPAAGPAIDVARAAADPKQTVRALLLRHRDSAATLGPHKFTGSARTVLRDGDVAVATLDEQYLIEAAADGVHAVYTNSRDVGRELYASGGAVWVRPRYGKFVRRAPVDAEEVASTCDDVYAALSAQAALVADGLVVSDGGAASVMGRPGRKVKLAGAGGRVRALRGEVVLDDKTGTVLAGKLEATVQLEGGRVLELEAQHALEPWAGPVVPPGEADAVATPLRATETEDREELLRGLAPPVVRKK